MNINPRGISTGSYTYDKGISPIFDKWITYIYDICSRDNTSNEFGELCRKTFILSQNNVDSIGGPKFSFGNPKSIKKRCSMKFTSCHYSSGSENATFVLYLAPYEPNSSAYLKIYLLTIKPTSTRHEIYVRAI